jgi:hypothetical protein
MVFSETLGKILVRMVWAQEVPDSNIPSVGAASVMLEALSRLAQQGALERISKGVYYRAGFTSAETSNWGHLATSRWTQLPEGVPNTPASSARGLGLKFAVIFG